MIQGTTPEHKFTLPFDTNVISKVRIIYAQDDTPLVIKNTEDCALENNTVSVKLSQADTLLFSCFKPVHIQIRVLTLGGESLISKPIAVIVSRCLEKEVLE